MSGKVHNYRHTYEFDLKVLRLIRRGILDTWALKKELDIEHYWDQRVNNALQRLKKQGFIEYVGWEIIE